MFSAIGKGIKLKVALIIISIVTFSRYSKNPEYTNFSFFVLSYEGRPPSVPSLLIWDSVHHVDPLGTSRKPIFDRT
jgi:hypothetical protein